MFWGCFTYDKKGPYHIWEPETARDREMAEKELIIANREREPLCKEEWELTIPMQRMNLRNLSGRKPRWSFTEKTGKLIYKGKGGIDWYRYQKVSGYSLYKNIY